MERDWGGNVMEEETMIMLLPHLKNVAIQNWHKHPYL